VCWRVESSFASVAVAVADSPSNPTNPP
jgi:hypothetical protein